MSVAAITIPASVARAQIDQMRFEITAPTDTTFTLILGDIRWVKKGMTGTVVDPRQRDDMVANFRVDKVDGRTARAVITGMRTGITVFHAALLRAPRKSWFKQKVFWIGSGLGIAVGYLIGKG
jgi:hypothetical protein